jgi:uncharacterized membrane protein YjfL (UPF0719 family)
MTIQYGYIGCLCGVALAGTILGFCGVTRGSMRHSPALPIFILATLIGGIALCVLMFVNYGLCAGLFGVGTLVTSPSFGIGIFQWMERH